MNYEEKILTYLVDNYRKSKKDSGDNKTNRRTQVKPEKLYKKYNANDGEFSEITKLEQAVKHLSEMKYVYSTKEKFGTRIRCIYLADERIQEVERYLAEKYGYISKDTQIVEMKKIVDKYQNASSICREECTRLQGCIDARKVCKNVEGLDDILRAVAFIENNQEELYIREASMKIYGDSKFFETTTLQPVCDILRRYSNREESDGELQDEILLDYHIAREPQKLCIKGKAIIDIFGREVDISGFSEGIEFMTSDFIHVKAIKLNTPVFMTIENRTSYLRYRKDNVVTFYLGGYANRYQRDFIKMIYANNVDVRYMHFGDIDAGGFWIHRNLCEITGVNFGLYCMSVDELQNVEFALCKKALTDGDRIRLMELKKFDAYTKVADYMLKNNIKLEQEIVSLWLMSDKTDAMG